MQTNRITSKPVAQVITAIEALDLESVKTQLVDRKGWTRERADTIEAGYKAFLKAVTQDQERAEEIKLSNDVDEFWHTHILDTMKYADDCDAVFGRFLHHKPQLGKVVENAAMCNVAASAMCNVAASAMCNVAASAMCNVAASAMCNVAASAMCNVAASAMCNVAASAMCNVAASAMCNVAVRPQDAMCNVGIRSQSAAMCNVAARN